MRAAFVTHAEFDRLKPDYPVGGALAVDSHVTQEAKRCGYRFACTYVHGLNPIPDYSRLALRRLKMEVGDDFARFRAKLLYPGLVRY
jgi:hypothetical protein